MKQLTINRARALGKDMNAKGIVILAFGDDGEFQACSYGRTKQDCGQLGRWLDGIYDAIESGEIAAPFAEQQSTERLTGDSARPAVNESRLIEAASAARSLLSKLSTRLEIDEELHAEVSRAEEALWGALFPGSAARRGANECSSAGDTVLKAGESPPFIQVGMVLRPMGAAGATIPSAGDGDVNDGPRTVVAVEKPFGEPAYAKLIPGYQNSATLQERCDWLRKYWVLVNDFDTSSESLHLASDLP